MTTEVESISRQKPRSLGSLLVGIIDKPAATFKAVLAQRKWWMWAVPLVILLLAFAVMTVVNLPYAQELAREQAEQRLATLPEEQAEIARSTMETSFSYPVMLATSLGFGSLALLIGIVAQATFLYFGALLAGGDDMEFGSVFTMSAWTRLPAAVGFLAMAGYVALTQQMIRYPGLTALIATGNLIEDAQNPLFAVLGRIDLFWLWHLVLVGIGLSVVARFGRGKAGVLTLSYAALALGLTALPTFLTQLMMGG